MSLAIAQTRDSLHTCSKNSLANQETLQGSSSTPRFKKAVVVTQNPEIPARTLFNFSLPGGILQGNNTSTSLPSVAECAAHLELLQAFNSLRIRILASTELDEILDITVIPRTVYRKIYTNGGRYTKTAVQLRDETFDQRRKVKWSLYLGLAASRFLRWVDAVEDEPNMLKKSIGLPPIDVLMVWHALLLNPQWFQTFQHRKLEKLASVAFPWQLIHDSITSEDASWPFQLSIEDKISFQSKTGMDSDLLFVLENAKTSPKLPQMLRAHIAKISNSQGLETGSQDGIEIQAYAVGLNHLEQSLAECLREAGNSTNTALVDAVQRQSLFVAKMDHQLWIRSPAIEGTLIRAITRYGQFLKLFKLYPRIMLVPTLDIDLVWHTHQCSHAHYLAATKAITGRFIDHDDKIVSEKLETGMQKTMDLYRIRFAEEYDYCCCWDCEALRSIIYEQTPNAEGNASSVAQKVHEDLAYHRAVEIARRKGEELLPIRG